MKKGLKLFAIIAGILLLLCVVAAIAIITLVSPNRLKPVLTAQVMKYTGRQLTIDGDLAWTFFPSLGVKTGHMALSNPDGFKQSLFAEIQSANISVHLLPLLKNRIESNGITLYGLKLFLIKNAKGQANWNFFNAATSKNDTISAASTNAKLPMSALGLAIAGVEVADGQVVWLDEQAQKTAKIDAFELHAKNINFLQPFPVTLSFKFASQHPAVEGQLSLKSNLAVNMTKQIFAFRSLELVVDTQQANKKMNVKLMGEVNADLLQQTLQWSDLQVEMGKLNLTGALAVTGLTSAPSATGQLQIAPFDLRAWLKDMGQDVTNIQNFKTVAGNFDITSVNHSTKVAGKLSVDAIEANHVKLTRVTIPVQFQDKVLSLAGVTADFYQGTLQTSAMVKLQTAVPQLVVNAKLANVQVGPLLDDLGSANKKLKFSGTTNVDLDVTTAGLDSPSVVKNLNGNAHFAVTNGTLEGVDLRYYIDVAKALLAQRAPTATNTNKTEFANLTGSTNIKNGVVQNDDLVVTSTLFTSKGKGQINLVSQQINYRLDTMVNNNGAIEDTGWVDLTKITIPVLITGSLNDPSVRLDSSSLTKAVSDTVIQKTKDDLKDKIQQQGGALLQNLLGH